MVQQALFGELKRQADKGVAILLSSHNLREVQEHCHRAAFIRKGEIIALANLKNEASAQQKIVTVTGGGEAPQSLELLRSDPQGGRVFRTQTDGQALIELLARLNPTTFTVAQESLEEHFMALYKEKE